MPAAELSLDESRRIKVLHDLQLLDTPCEPEFDDLTVIASALCGVPTALISLVDTDRQWFKSRVGMDLRETPREQSFCAHAILDPSQPLIVRDARVDPRFSDNPLVLGPTPVVFYAGFPIRDRVTGLPLGTICVVDSRPQDLSERHLDGLRALARQVEQRIEARSRTQEALADRARFEATLASSPHGIFITDRQGGCVYVNGAWCRIAGMSLGRARGAGWTEAIHPDDRERISEQWYRCARERTTFQSEARFLRDDGKLVWTSVTAGEILDEDDMLGYVGIVEDITARRRTERALRESEGRLLEAQAIARLGYFTLDIATQVVQWSPQLSIILGLDPTSPALNPEQYLQRVHEEDRPRLAELLHLAATQGDGFEFEYRIIRGNGEVRWVRGRAVARPGSDGQISALRGTVQDITDDRRTHEEMVLAKNYAERAAQAKSDFLTTMSHEIRTPLNGVIGMTDLLLQTPLSDEQADYVATTKSSGQILLAVINDVLDFSKLEAGKVELEAVEYSPRQLIEDTAAVLAEQAQSKGVELVVDIANSVPARLVGDPNRLRQVMINLLANAVKFTDQGEVIVVLSGSRVDQNAFRLRVEIRDSGVGIPPDRLGQLFHPFAQADSSTTRRFGGTGLGLAISRHLVDLMKGTIDVLSTPEMGSTFTVQVRQPIAIDQEAGEAPEIERGTRVLLIEASRPVRGAIAAICESAGISVDLVSRISDIPAALGDEPHDVVIIGGTLPDMIGFKPAIDLRESLAGKLPPMVLTAEITQRSTLPDGLFAGVALRPVRRLALLSAISAALRGREATVIRASVNVEGSERRKPHILVAEDNPVNQMVVASLLRKMQCVVEVVADGRKALEACIAIEFDLVFMDCLMPFVDGFAATRAIRARESGGRHLPIVALTANALEGDREKCLSSGMDDYLSKPIDAARLRAMVERWCLTAGSGSPSGAPTLPASQNMAQ